MKKYVVYLLLVSTPIIADFFISEIENSYETLLPYIKKSSQKFEQNYNQETLDPEVLNSRENFPPEKRVLDLLNRNNAYTITITEDNAEHVFITTHQEGNLVFVDSAYIPENLNGSIHMLNEAVARIKQRFPESKTLIFFTPKLKDSTPQNLLQAIKAVPAMCSNTLNTIFLQYIVGIKKTDKHWSGLYSETIAHSWEKAL